MIINTFVFTIIALVAVLLTAIYQYLKGRLSEKKILSLLFISGIILRVSYIAYTGAQTRQHDVHTFGGVDGHAAYIEYIFNNKALPNFNPTLLWQFYHPPIHHIISAIWLYIMTFIGISYEYAIEGLQILPMIYSSACMFIGHKIFKCFDLKGVPLYIAVAFIAFNPSFIIMSGSLNNDMLSVLFIFLVILNTLKWYENPNYKSIIYLAFSIGLGMITKLSVALLSPCVALVFLIKLITSSGKRLSLIKQFIVFGIICVPIGLSWTLRNYVLFDVPVNYVPLLSEDNAQYIGNVPFIQRLLDFSSYQFRSLYTAWGDSRFGLDGYYEFNPTIGLFKTAVFGEYVFNTNQLLPIIGANILLYSFIVCLFFILIGGIYFVINYDIIKRPVNTIFISLITAVYLFSYYKFCFDYPHTCTMNIRYVMVLLPFMALVMGKLLEVCKNNNSVPYKIMKYTLFSVVTLFCVTSALFYAGLSIEI